MDAIVYSPQITQRVEYIFSTLLAASGIAGVRFTNEQGVYNQPGTVKFNYSDQQISEEEVWIKPAGLLFEKTIQQQQINCFEWRCSSSPVNAGGESVTCFYRVNESNLPFDIFSASFYLLTRYEEYLPHIKDKYGRYAHENSIAFQKQFLHIPLVNIWLGKLRKLIAEKYSAIDLSASVFKFTPTYDIDIAWSFLNKGFIRNAGGFLKNILQGNWSTAGKRLQVLLLRMSDPFDSYNWLQALHTASGLHPVYFFLLAQKNKGYDKNVLPSNTALQNLIKRHASQYDIGIHPSWQSGDDGQILRNEISLLQNITGQKIRRSRQHYIRMTLPDTYQKLLQSGIADDYSMGYGSINGFRGSYCLPHKWYDLQTEQTTELTIHPFCFMEANSFYEQHLTAQQAYNELMNYYTIVKSVNGELITIWHNHFFGTDKMFAGWKEMYEKFVSSQKA